MGGTFAMSDSECKCGARFCFSGLNALLGTFNFNDIYMLINLIEVDKIAVNFLRALFL